MKCGGCGTNTSEYLLFEGKCSECDSETGKVFSLIQIVVLSHVLLFLLVIIWL
jgi:hypothetical protein